ncbi:MAG TPA: PCRF domain-containing protein, partial [Candidatus Eremiobacteraceae bacterium]|nr:PCRF domain-containing protein [Candidatus Eremiobacteraceae bacterium]
MDHDSTLAGRLRAITTRFDEIETRLAALGSSFDPDENKRLSKERATLEPTVSAWTEHQELARKLTDAETMVRDSDPDVAEMAKAEVQVLREQLSDSERLLRVLLVPRD